MTDAPITAADSEIHDPSAAAPIGRRNLLRGLGLGAVGAALPVSVADAASAKAAKSPKRNIVLIPGAFHGGWYFSPIVEDLRAAGHTVFTISLSGLQGPVERPHVGINLDTHIDDVVSLVELEKLDDVMLVGHSYGGMVVAGASERLAGRVKTLLFIDAMLPADGESVWTLLKNFNRDHFIADAHDGLVTAAPPGVDPRARAHPLATFLQPVKLTSAAYAPRTKVYAMCNAQGGTPFEGFYKNKAQDPAWIVRTLPSHHDFMKEAPLQARDLILSTAAMTG
jgi:pimeloyl-ACP methyl ester carboxylesterase